MNLATRLIIANMVIYIFSMAIAEGFWSCVCLTAMALFNIAWLLVLPRIGTTKRTRRQRKQWVK